VYLDFILIINPFTAKVANKQLLGRPPKLIFGTKSHKNENIYLSKMLY
jgi:hypothetical protein